jgi:hypothetical protein
MKLTRNKLRRLIKEEVQKIITESEMQRMLGLGHEFSNSELYYAAMNMIRRNPDLSGYTGEGEMLEKVIRNRMVKEQIGMGHPDYENFSMILNVLDNNRGRRASYRRGIEDEMREADPTGREQRSGRMARMGNRIHRFDY